MPKVVKKRRRGRKRATKRHNQHGGVFPLLALAMPAIIAASKAAALGGVGAAAGYGVKRGLDRIGR